MPNEVIDFLKKTYGIKTKRMYVEFFEKERFSRAEAWFSIRLVGSENDFWRKCHTKNYWVWTRKMENFFKKGDLVTLSFPPSTKGVLTKVLDNSHLGAVYWFPHKKIISCFLSQITHTEGSKNEARETKSNT